MGFHVANSTRDTRAKQRDYRLDLWRVARCREAIAHCCHCLLERRLSTILTAMRQRMEASSLEPNIAEIEATLAATLTIECRSKGRPGAQFHLRGGTAPGLTNSQGSVERPTGWLPESSAGKRAKISSVFVSLDYYSVGQWQKSQPLRQVLNWSRAK